MSSGGASTDGREMGRLLGERSPAGLYLATPRGELVDCNDAFATLLGYGSRDEALASPTPLLGGTLRSPSEPDGAVSAVETCIARRDGSTVRVLRSEAVAESRGERLIVGALVDMTLASSSIEQRRELDEQVRQAQKMEAVGRLAGGIAHDFNNLLAVILSYASLVHEGLDERDPARRDVAEIQRAAQRAAALTRQLLTVSRRGPAQPVVLELRSLVDEMDRPIRDALGEGIELTTAHSASPCRILADSAQLQQVVMNLALNARDAMPNGGRLTIETRSVEIGAAGRLREEHPAIPPGRYARLVVVDTGGGMSDDVRTRAFEPFFTTKPRGKGAGLGLATAYGIVKQSRGHIEIDSRPGEGTRVEVYLPLSPRPSQSRRARAAPQASRRSAGGTVLVADDEDAVVALACRVLAQSGYRTLPARGPEEALRISQEQKGRIDLLLTDVLMPGMTGRELAARISEQRPEMRVLFMSGYTGDALPVADATAVVLDKPFTSDALLRCVRRLLGGRGRLKTPRRA